MKSIQGAAAQRFFSIAPAPRVHLIALLAMGLSCTPASSETGSSTSPFKLGRQDYAWGAAAVGVEIPAFIRYRDMPSVDTASLNRNDLLPLDRWATGIYSPVAATASDLLVAPFCALPVALTALDAWKGGQGWSPVLTDGVIYGEALAISSSLDLLVRSLQVHPRPLVYGHETPAAERLSGEASGSFYSGHASAAFLTAVYLSYTYPLRHPGFQYQGWLWAGSLTTATAIASLRVVAGKHFPSDVIVGAAVGGFFGWAFPRMHLSAKPESKAGTLASPSIGMQVDDLGFYPKFVWTF